MNERIDELFGQALDQSVPETWTTLNPAQLSKLKEKFAELVVEECASICYNSGMHDSDAHAQNLLYEFNIHNCRGDK